MTLTADNFPIYVALVCAVLSLVVAIISARDDRARRVSCRLYIISVICTAYASIYLMQAILSGARYDIAYIHDYSSMRDALIYRISSFWAGQEGSLLLWAGFVGIIGIILPANRNTNGPVTRLFWTTISIFMLVLLIVSDPFKQLPDFAPGMVGAGLNPLLKNPWMAVHPPVVFLGYAALMVPGAIALQNMLSNTAKSWTKPALAWALIGWGFLTAGIALGMIWSYEVLGWGGFWGWDPVENASLIPWLSSIALIHGLLVEKRRKAFIRWNYLLAVMTFLLILYATFLTRSGILADLSVHSFADLGTYSYLLGFLIFYAVITIGALVTAWVRKIETEKPKPEPRETAVVFGIIVIMVFGFIVLAGTTLPIFTGSTIEPGMYTRLSIPAVVAVLILALTAVAYDRKRKTDPKVFMIAIIVAILLVPATGCIVTATKSIYLPAIFASTAGAGLIIYSLARLFNAKIAYSGAHIAHAGIGFLVIGITLYASGKTDTISVDASNQTRIHGYGISYKGLSSGPAGDTIRLEVERGGRKHAALLRFEKTRSGELRKPYIQTSFTGDLYLAPIEIRRTIVVPEAKMTDRGWISAPVGIPGTHAALTLLGMCVEDKSLRLEFKEPGKPGVEVAVSEKNPTDVAGYTLSFMRFVSTGDSMIDMTAGAEIAVRGRGLRERVIIEASTKPFVGLVWLGLVFIVFGGVVAALRRTREMA